MYLKYFSPTGDDQSHAQAHYSEKYKPGSNLKRGISKNKVPTQIQMICKYWFQSNLDKEGSK